MAEAWFSPGLFKFLKELEKNNNREWFADNKQRYVELAQEPANEFIEAAAAQLSKISKEFTSGSLFRIHRDTRFSNDKTPYKTNVAMRFSHRKAASGDVHVPGFYLSLESSGKSYGGGGIWRPDTSTAHRIRLAIAAKPSLWKKAVHQGAFPKHLSFDGESLKRVPKDLNSEHELADDLRRKDFIGMSTFTQAEVTSPKFLSLYLEKCKALAPMIKFICEATGQPF